MFSDGMIQSYNFQLTFLAFARRARLCSQMKNKAYNILA